MPLAPTARFDAAGFWLVGPGLAALLGGLAIAGLGQAPFLVIGAMVITGTFLVTAYVRHSMRITNPLVDLRLLFIPTFRIAAIGGTLFRLGGGALPFLLPLMLQASFGLNAFQSGMLTFASGFGAILMKFIAQSILQRFGFRNVLLVNAGLSAAMILAPAGFTSATPYWAMVGVLFLGGIFRSLQFTSINAIAYADVESAKMGSATSFNAVLQQLSASIGISIAALALQTIQHLTGGTTTDPAHFPPVFALLALLSLGSAIWFWRLASTAGDLLLENGRPR
ncbi:MAG: MFS transporter [Nitratireductor sp.]